MIVEERYGMKCNAEEFSVEVKRGNLYCSPELVNILYLIGRAKHRNKDGVMVHTSEILKREAFSPKRLEEFLDEKDRLKRAQKDIDIKVALRMDGDRDPTRERQIRIENGWAMKEADE